MANFTIFPTTSRPAGTYISATAPYSGRTAVVTWQLVSSTWATDNPALSVRVQCQWSFNNGVSWDEVTETTIHPGEFSEKTGGLPAVSYQAGDNQGARLVRVVMTLSGTITVGLTGSAS